MNGGTMMSRRKAICIGLLIFLILATAGLGAVLFIKVFNQKCFEIFTEE